ncbi:hypothetical protein HO133_007535 [Letharia lupina]|uniref:Uncharacterized protein n=1 Tax=Letharia lupina TaxID=560253 RepID=A0A8H6FIZ3_9LECA|nr:uncharacterized protein HO133_007535 [Letharia lupina]KAF6229419.1 hypothetical protein HO133_007535 [Letharia lupina]
MAGLILNGKPQRSWYTVRQNAKHHLNPLHRTPDPYPIESAFRLSVENVFKASGDTKSSTAASELSNAPIEDGDDVTGPAEVLPTTKEEDQSRLSCARSMQGPDEQVVADQV